MFLHIQLLFDDHFDKLQVRKLNLFIGHEVDGHHRIAMAS